MDYKKLNEVLSNLSIFYLERNFKVIAKFQSDDYGRELDQGDTSSRTLILDVGLDVFLKVVIECDSYGDNEGVSSIAFVKETTKEVVVYE